MGLSVLLSSVHGVVGGIVLLWDLVYCCHMSMVQQVRWCCYGTYCIVVICPWCGRWDGVVMGLSVLLSSVHGVVGEMVLLWDLVYCCHLSIVQQTGWCCYGTQCIVVICPLCSRRDSVVMGLKVLLSSVHCVVGGSVVMGLSVLLSSVHGVVGGMVLLQDLRYCHLSIVWQVGQCCYGTQGIVVICPWCSRWDGVVIGLRVLLSSVHPSVHGVVLPHSWLSECGVLTFCDEIVQKIIVVVTLSCRTVLTSLCQI